MLLAGCGGSNDDDDTSVGDDDDTSVGDDDDDSAAGDDDSAGDDDDSAGDDDDSAGCSLICGDLNGDGLVNTADVTLISDHIVGTVGAPALDDCQLWAANTNGDAFINVSDILVITTGGVLNCT
jgi:hypothetical protein